MRYFTLEEVLELHFMIIEDFGGSHGVRDELRLRSLLEAPQLVVFGTEQYPNLHHKAAVYMRNAIANHIFVDDNKRTGTTLAALFLERHCYELTAAPSQLEDFVVYVATSKPSVEDIATWLNEHSAPVT